MRLHRTCVTQGAELLNFSRSYNYTHLSSSAFVVMLVWFEAQTKFRGQRQARPLPGKRSGHEFRHGVRSELGERTSADYCQLPEQTCGVNAPWDQRSVGERMDPSNPVGGLPPL